MSWLSRTAKGNLVIIDESSEALARYKEQYTKLGYKVCAVLAVPATERFAQLRHEDGTVDEVQAAIQRNAGHTIPRRLDAVNFMVSNADELRSVLESLKPAPDFVLSDRIFDYATSFINGTYVMGTARVALPDAALVMQSPNYYDHAESKGQIPFNLETAMLQAKSGYAEVLKDVMTRKPQPHLVFEAIARSREAALTA